MEQLVLDVLDPVTVEFSHLSQQIQSFADEVHSFVELVEECFEVFVSHIDWLIDWLDDGVSRPMGIR